MNKQLQNEIILGVDTHLDQHVGVIINSYGKYLGNRSIETNSSGYQKLLKWVQSFGILQRAGVEG